jgi:hypothetical protein
MVSSHCLFSTLGLTLTPQSLAVAHRLMMVWPLRERCFTTSRHILCLSASSRCVLQLMRSLISSDVRADTLRLAYG